MGLPKPVRGKTCMCRFIHGRVTLGVTRAAKPTTGASSCSGGGAGFPAELFLISPIQDAARPGSPRHPPLGASPTHPAPTGCGARGPCRRQGSTLTLASAAAAFVRGFAKRGGAAERGAGAPLPPPRPPPRGPKSAFPAATRRGRASLLCRRRSKSLTLPCRERFKKVGFSREGCALLFAALTRSREEGRPPPAPGLADLRQADLPYCTGRGFFPAA